MGRAQRCDKSNGRPPVFLQPKEGCITRSKAKLLQTTRQPSRLKNPNSGFKVTRSWSVQLLFESPKRCRNCVKGWSLTKGHRLGIFVIANNRAAK
jgi:hypothetical protein